MKKQFKHIKQLETKNTSKYHVEKRSEYSGIKYIIGYQPPGGYLVLPADIVSKKIFGGENMWFDDIEDAEEHAEISIDSYLEDTIDENISLKENYIRFFGHLTEHDGLGRKKGILKEGYFDNYTQEFGIMTSVRDIQKAYDVIFDNPRLKRQQPRERGSNVFLFNDGDDLMEALQIFEAQNIEIEKLRINGEEIDYDSDTFDPGNFDLY